MATPRSEYLKKYLSGSESGEAKKKKRKKRPAGSQKPIGFKIVDEDIDISAVAIVNPVEEEEGPTVAEVIDERPEEIKLLEKYQNQKWKKLNHAPQGEEASPPRRTRHDSEDYSPPRRKRHDSDDYSPPRRKRNDSDDNSPPRRNRSDSDDNSPPRRKRNDSDNSPPRRQNNDADQSPPRRREANDPDQSPPRKRRNEEKDVMKKTLSGKLAGLSSAADMKREAEKLKQRETEAFRKIDDGLLGRNAATVFRDKKTGKRRDVQGEKEDDEAQKKEISDKYKQWNKGLKQEEAATTRVEEMVHEMSKPLARMADDADRDAYLMDQERDGDPMLAFIKKKKSSKAKGPKYPKYNGPAPPNRFNIRPGYRWDGVDRSTGFEKQYFLSMSNKKAVATEAYKWSTEDM